MYSYGSPHMAAQKQDDQHERTFSSYVRIQVVVLKTCLGRWTIGRSGERGSGISVLPARYDDDDDDFKQFSLVWVQFNCQKHSYFKLLSLVKQFYFKKFSSAQLQFQCQKTVLLQTIHISIGKRFNFKQFTLAKVRILNVKRVLF